MKTVFVVFVALVFVTGIAVALAYRAHLRDLPRGFFGTWRSETGVISFSEGTGTTVQPDRNQSYSWTVDDDYVYLLLDSGERDKYAYAFRGDDELEVWHDPSDSVLYRRVR